MNFIKLLNEKLNVGEINDIVADETCGAISIFVGTTRDNFEDKKVISLEYEAYDKMAIKVMNEICDKIRIQWADVKNIAIYHRLGNVPVKEASVVIAISSPHRKSSLDSVQYTIDELKKLVPIWKKEQYKDHDPVWKENKECKEKDLKTKRRKFDLETHCKVNMTILPKNLIQINADDSEVDRRISCFIDKKRKEINLNNILDFTALKNKNINKILLDDKSLEENDDSCARINAVYLKSSDSKGHLKVHRVKNESGPQESSNYTKALDKLMEDLSKEPSIKKEKLDLLSDGTSITTNTRKENDSCINKANEISLKSNFNAVEERIKNAEQFLNLIAPCSKNIYERLKAIEEKILYLESLSPEYRYFGEKNHKSQHFQPMETESISNTPPTVEESKLSSKKVYSIDEISSFMDQIKSKINSKIKKEI